MSDALSSDEPPFVSGAIGNRGDEVAAGVASEIQSSPESIVAGSAMLIDVSLVFVWIAMTDFLIYRVGTYVAWSLCFAGTLLLLTIAKRASRHWNATLLMSAFIVLLAIKLLWCGSQLQIACGVFVAFCLAMATSGLPPFLPELAAFVGMVFGGAPQRLSRYRVGHVSQANRMVMPWITGSVLVPLALVFCFVVLFVLANPDVASKFSSSFRLIANSISNWLIKISFNEVVFVLASGWLILGLLYPISQKLIAELAPAELSQVKTRSTYFSTARNALLSLNGLFAVYLIFEFATLWFREFPDDFYYAGYAHQGAFWLTLALALSTLILSAIFRGSMLRDPALPGLMRLAGAWSLQNIVLAIAVYNRLYIYIDFNGLTRMRVIALLGIGCVVGGLVLVIIKIWKHRDFIWLLHRQLWLPVFAVITYAILPVDWLVHEVNVRRVLQGEPASSVQIVAHLHSAEGALPLAKLVNYDDPIIRNGVRAILAIWAEELKVRSTQTNGKSDFYRGSYRPELGHTTPWLWVRSGFSKSWRVADMDWFNWQAAEQALRAELLKTETEWQPYSVDSTLRDQAIDEFYKHAYQWY